MEPMISEAYGSLGDPALPPKYGNLGGVCQVLVEPIENKRICCAKRAAFVAQPDDLQLINS